jgi:hypothetical protein
MNAAGPKAQKSFTGKNCKEYAQTLENHCDYPQHSQSAVNGGQSGLCATICFFDLCNWGVPFSHFL